MKAYISVSYSKRKQLNDEIYSIKEALLKFKIEPFVFVDQLKFAPEQEKQMMEEAMQSLDECDMLIAETSEKGIGIGIEVGYAKAKGKLVIYLRNKNAEHSTTVSGMSDYQIIYNDAIELNQLLKNILSEIRT